MEQRAGKTYLVDSVVIWVSLGATWCVLVFTLVQVVRLADDVMTRAVLVGSAILAGVFATSALLALFLHLRRHRTSLYVEDRPPIEEP